MITKKIQFQQEWRKCQLFSNTIELYKRIRIFDVRDVTIETAEVAWKLLSAMRYEDVLEASGGAATFYQWV